MPGIWDQYTGAAPEQSVDKPWWDDALEVGRQAAAGVAVDLPRMAGQAARWVAPDSTAMDDWGRSTVEAANARAPGWEPDMQGRGGLASTLIKGARAVGPMAPAIAASLLPGGQWIAPSVAASQFGASSAQDTEDKLRLQGVDDSTATAAGWRTGLIQGPLEGVATAVGARAFKPLLGIGSQTTAGVAARLTDTAVAKPLAKGLALNLVAQPAVEVAQDLGTEFNERYAGAAPEDAWEIAKDSAQGGLGLTMLLGPFAAGAHVRRSRVAGQLRDALNSPDPMVQAQARDFVVTQAGREGVKPADAEAWLDAQFAADDSAALARSDARSAVLRDAVAQVPQGVVSAGAIDRAFGLNLPSPTDAQRSAYAQAFENAASEGTGQFVSGPDGIERELTALEAVQQGRVSTLGDIASTAPAGDTQSASAAQQVLQAHSEAVQAAQQPLTPEQQRAQAVRDAAQQVAQMEQAREQRARKDFGITQKGAIATYGDLEDAHVQGLIDDSQFAQAAGMLAGNANGLGKVRQQLNGLRKEAEATRLQAEQAARTTQADQAQQAADAAKLQEPSIKDSLTLQPTAAPAQQNANSRSGATAASDAINSAAETPARSQSVLRQRIYELLTSPSASPALKQRVQQATGFQVDEDPDTGQPTLIQVGTPQAMAEVARAAKVSRAAVSKQLGRYGLTEADIDMAVATAAPSVNAYELGITTGEDSEGPSGFRVSDTASDATNIGLLEGRALTAQEKKVQAQADAMLKADPEGAEDAVQDDFEAKRRENAERELRAAIAQVENTPAWQQARTDWDDMKSEAAPAFDDLPVGHQLEWWDTHKELAREHGTEFKPFEQAQQAFERSYMASPEARARVDGGERSTSGQDAGGAAGEGGSATQETDLEGARFSRTHATIAGQKDHSGAPLRITRTDLDTLRAAHPTVQRVTDAYVNAGMAHVLDTIQDWYVTDQTVDFAGAFTLLDGRPAMVLTTAELASPNLPMTLHHELGHALDLLVDGGEFSSRPELNLRVETGPQGEERVRGFGAVAREVIAQASKDPDSVFGVIMEYPLDRQVHGDLDADGVRQEMFAQLWLLYNGRAARKYIQDNMPHTSRFMEEVYGQVETDPDYRAAIAAVGKGAADGQSGTDTFREFPAGTRIQEGDRPAAIWYRRKTGAVAGDLDKTAALPAPVARAQGSVAQLFHDVKSKAVLWGAFTEDLAAAVADKIPSVTKYISLVKEAQVAKTRAERQVEAVLDMYQSLPAHERGTGPSSVNAFLKASTTEKTWGYKPDFLPNATVDQATSQRFNRLSPKAQELVRAVFQHGHETLQQLKAAVEDNVHSEFDALIAAHEAAGDKEAADRERKVKAKELQDFHSLQALNGDWPYAPLKRFGNHVVVGMSQAYLDAEKSGTQGELDRLKADEAHYFVAFAETRAEARKMREQVAGRYAYSDNFEKDQAQEQLYGGRDVLGVFRRLRDLVNSTQDEHLKANASRALNRLMVDLHLTLLSEQSARQAERNRIGVAGADNDMMRAFATQGRATAHFIASLQNNGRIQDELQAMRQEADARAPGREGRRDAFNEVLRRHAMNLDYRPSPLVERAMGASSVWMLLTSPAYFLTNATQPWVMTLPVLAGRHGYARSSAALFKAYQDILPLVKDGAVSQEDYSRLPADVRSVVQTLVDAGSIDISLEQDLGRWRSTEDSKLRHLGHAVDKLRGVAQTVESVNRLTTAIAAARLAGTANAAAAQAYAQRVIYDTHGDYSGFNSPRAMRSGVGRLVTQFRKFQLIQLSLYAKLLHGAFKGASADERSVARSALTWSLGHMFMLGGLLGMPGAQAIGWLLRQVFGDDDEPDNPELTLRRLVPEELADLLTKGVPKALGVDISGRVGAGNMLSILPYADTSLDRKGYEAAVMGLLGPFVGGLMPKFADGVGLMGQHQWWKGLEQMLPKGFADVSKAARQAAQGVSQRNGDVVMTPDDLNLLDTAMQALGLPTTTLTDRSFRASSAFKADEFYKGRTAQVKRDYVAAYRSGNQSDMVSARQEWQQLQDARARNGFKRQTMSELFKAPHEQAKRERSTAGGVQFSRQNEGFVRGLAMR